MNEFSDTELWIAVLLAFGAGYFIVSFLARLMKTEPPAPPGALKTAAAASGYDPIALQAERCAQLLGVRLGASETEIERAYRESLAKYQTDKVGDLGAEFRYLADVKIKEIEEAYAVLTQARARK